MYTFVEVDGDINVIDPVIDDSIIEDYTHVEPDKEIGLLGKPLFDEKCPYPTLQEAYGGDVKGNDPMAEFNNVNEGLHILRDRLFTLSREDMTRLQKEEEERQRLKRLQKERQRAKKRKLKRKNLNPIPEKTVPQFGCFSLFYGATLSLYEETKKQILSFLGA